MSWGIHGTASALRFSCVDGGVSCSVKTLAPGETTSAVAGQVGDATSAVVPGAIVTITNPDTGLKLRVNHSVRGEAPAMMNTWRIS